MVLVAQYQEGRVTLGLDRVIWLMLYVSSNDKYEKILRMRSGEAIASRTSVGLLPGPALGRGIAGKDSVIE